MSPAASTAVLRGLPRGLAVWACLATAACASATGGSGPATAPGDGSAEAARSERPAGSHSADDVSFMRGMIHHHAQAVAMARLVPDRTGSPAVRRLAARILNSQETEISLMADWLRDRGEPVPELASSALAAAQEERAPGAAERTLAPPGGWDAGMQMPGLLSDQQMARLEEARGEDFDRLFLRYMIEHHGGAVTMVEKLVRSPDGAREESVFRLASGIRADQSSEIDRMRTMLRESLFEGDSP